MNTRIAAVAAVGASLFVAGWTANGWRVGVQLQAEKTAHIATREAYQGKLAQSLAEAMKERERLAQAARGVIRERNDEVDRLRVAADRIPDTVRVRVQTECPVPAGASNQAGGAGDDSSSAGRFFPVSVDGDHQELDIRQVTELMRQADAVAADLRAVLAVCR